MQNRPTSRDIVGEIIVEFYLIIAIFHQGDPWNSRARIGLETEWLVMFETSNIRFDI